MTRLNRIPVHFNQTEHTYTNTETGETYEGITGTLIHRLFPDKYKSIPKRILENAASRGTLVHEELELMDSLDIEPKSEEGRGYKDIKTKYGLVPLENEYTVSDLRHFATNIDAVYEVEDNVVDLADFKTTSKLDTESVSWQLSICAYMLEMNSPHVRVRKLYGIWLRGDIARLVEVRRHGGDEVEALMRAYTENTDFEWSPDYPGYITENETALTTIGKRIRELTEEYDTIKAEIMEGMVKAGDKSFDLGEVLLTLVAPSKRESFDSKRFKAEHSDLYGQYTKTTETKESLKITFR